MTRHSDEPTAAGRLRSGATWENADGIHADLLGTVPWGWIAVAAHLPGKSLHVAIALWHAAVLHRADTVSFSNLTAHRFGLDRNSKYRGLTWLEEAGLARIERRLGQSPRVTLLGRGANNDEQV